MRELRKARVEVALTSGRPPRGLRMLIEPLGLTTPLAAFNGGMFVNPDLTIIEQRTLPTKAARQAVALIQRHGLDVWVYREADWYIRMRRHPMSIASSARSNSRRPSFLRSTTFSTKP